MRLSRLAWATAGVLLLGVLAGAWFLPGMLDWNRYRGTIEALATDTLGRGVRIAGPIQLSLLPQPMLTAGAVTVGNEGGPGITAAQLRLRVALGALLSGRVDAQELVLHGVDLELPWPVSPDALVLRAPSWLSSLSARIEDGRLVVGGMVFTGINASLNTSDSTGTYMAAGTAQQSGRDWRFTLRLSRPGGDGSAGLDVTLDGQGKVQGVGASLSGQIVSDGTMVGRIALRGPDLSQLLPAPAVPFRADGRLNIAAGLAVADELTVELAGSPARGAVALRVLPAPRLDLALTASRLDLDAWSAALLRAADGDVMPKLPVGIDLSAEAGQLAGGTLRGLRGAFDLADGVMQVRELRAVLPGDAMLRVAGRATSRDARSTPPKPGRFEGEVAVEAASLRATLAWLKGAGLPVSDRLPEGVLRSAAISGHVVVEPGQVAVDKLAGKLDGDGIGGSLTLRLPAPPEAAKPNTPPAAPARPAVGAGLTLERLDLGPWMPARLPTLASISTGIAAVDIDLRLEAKQARLGAVSLGPLSLDAAVDAGRLTLRRLDFVVDGAHAAASGSVVEGRIVEGRLDVQAPQAAPLAALLPDSLAYLGNRAPGLWRSPANLQLLASGAAEQLALKVTADVGDLRVEAQPTLDLPGGRATGSLTLRHPGAPRLMEALGVVGAPSWLGDGSLGLVAQISLAGERLTAENFDVTAGALRASGSLAVQRGDQGFTVSGRVTAETLPLPLPYFRSPDPIPFTGLAGWQGSVKLEAAHVLAGQSPVLEAMSAMLNLSGSALRIDGLTANIGGGALRAAIGVDLLAAPPAVSLTAQISGAHLVMPLLDLPLDLTEGTIDGTLALQAAGYSPAALLATLGGTLALAVHDGVLSGVSLGAVELGGAAPDASVAKALAGGTTPFERFDVAAKAEHGTLRLERADLVGPEGAIAMTGSIDLPGASADLRLALRPKPPEDSPAGVAPPEIGLHLNGGFDALRRTPELADLTRWRAARATQ